jgi:ParB family chromosome partitioning protein
MAKASKAAFTVPRGTIFHFDPCNLVLVEDPSHPLYDDRINLPIDDGLVRNIMANGVIEPVVIRKGPNGSAEVVDGRQRVRCAREANSRLEENGKEQVRVPALIRRGTEADLFGVAVSANENRQDDTPLGRAQKAAKLINMGRTEAEVAIAFGCSEQSIRNWLDLLEVSAAIRKAVEAGQIAASAAVQLGKLPPAKQAKALKELASSPGKKTAAKARALVDKAEGKKTTASKKMKSRTMIEKRIRETRSLHPIYLEALCWVLGVEPSFFDR